MKYLINGNVCEKVEVEGFEYYTKNMSINIKDYYLEESNKGLVVCRLELGKCISDGIKIIATNNSSLDLPQVVDEVDVTDKTVSRQVWQKGYNKAKETFEFTRENMVEFAEWLSNIKYGQFEYFNNDNTLKPFEELFDIWNKQRVIKLNVK